MQTGSLRRSMFWGSNKPITPNFRGAVPQGIDSGHALGIDSGHALVYEVRVTRSSRTTSNDKLSRMSWVRI